MKQNKLTCYTSLKCNGDFQFFVWYAYLNSQIYAQIWRITNLDNVLQAISGHLRFSGVNSFSGFLVIPMEEGSKKHTAFVVSG
jgi:hypothetical protein